ncbi:tellurite resistance TerB family protein [Rhodoligotrophos ferricapiens]|uniref:tellurite resistance TerB family protein n=1 Tax=Rhodoligotrophos ferricapiens TaxID=3069264 RepID=UPI00315D3FFB
MIDPQKLLEQFLGGKAGGIARQIPGLDKLGGGHGKPAGFGGLAQGTLATGVIGLLLGSKRGRKLASNALVYGGLAALGGIAYKAYRDWQAQQQAATPVGSDATAMAGAISKAETTGFLPPQSDAAARGELSMAVLRAMIAAAKADGHIDAEEQQRLFGHMDTLGLGTEEKAFVMDELRKPLDIDAVVRGVKSPEQAVEIYAASLLAIDPDHPAEKAYLDELARRLQLAPDLVAHITAEVAAATEPT